MCHYNKPMANKKVFIVNYNDLHFTNHGKNVIGVLPYYEEALLMGWKAVVEDAKKPWTVAFYKKWDEKVKSRGLGSYTVEEWDLDANERKAIYALGEVTEGSMVVCVTDNYLKQNHKDCESILDRWYESLMVSKVVPDELRYQTFLMKN